jgi:hypothetical protein
MSDRLEHPADLTVTALLHHQNQPARSRFTLLAQLNAFRLGDAILQPHSVHQAAEGFLRGGPFHIHPVLLCRFVARMEQAVCGLAIVGEQQQPRAVPVQPTDMEEMQRLLGKQIIDRLPPRRIITGGDKSARLVERDPLGGEGLNNVVVHANHIT